MRDIGSLPTTAASAGVGVTVCKYGAFDEGAACPLLVGNGAGASGLDSSSSSGRNGQAALARSAFRSPTLGDGRLSTVSASALAERSFFSPLEIPPPSEYPSL